MTQLALILFSFPIEDIRADSFELVEFGDQDLPVQVMSQIDPHPDEEYEIRSRPWTVYVM